MDDTREVTQDCEKDVDQEVCTAASLEEDTDGRQNDGKNNLADIASGERHVGYMFRVRLKGSTSFGYIEYC